MNMLLFLHLQHSLLFTKLIVCINLHSMRKPCDRFLIDFYNEISVIHNRIVEGCFTYAFYNLFSDFPLFQLSFGEWIPIF